MAFKRFPCLKTASVVVSLGMAGVQTASANGVDTSPVTRGIFVLENILGIQPPPPPDEVPSIDSDVSSATTIREKLALHSEDSNCHECHRKIDPPRFQHGNFRSCRPMEVQLPQAERR